MVGRGAHLTDLSSIGRAKDCSRLKKIFRSLVRFRQVRLRTCSHRAFIAQLVERTLRRPRGSVRYWDRNPMEAEPKQFHRRVHLVGRVVGCLPSRPTLRVRRLSFCSSTISFWLFPDSFNVHGFFSLGAHSIVVVQRPSKAQARVRFPMRAGPITQWIECKPSKLEIRVRPPVGSVPLV